MQIWISPVVENINQTTAYGQAYHGFWSQDITKLNDNFGTEQDLLDLSTALHDRDMVRLSIGRPAGELRC